MGPKWCHNGTICKVDILPLDYFDQGLPIMINICPFDYPNLVWKDTGFVFFLNIFERNPLRVGKFWTWEICTVVSLLSKICPFIMKLIYILKRYGISINSTIWIEIIPVR